MHILQMSAKVATLSEGLQAEGAFEGPHTCVLPEVVPKIAAFFENTATSLVFAFEVELDSLSFWILNSDGLVPLLWNTIEGFMFASL